MDPENAKKVDTQLEETLHYLVIWYVCLSDTLPLGVQVYIYSFFEEGKSI